MNLTKHKRDIYKINTSSGSGTGFFIQGKNYLITNHHVVEGHKEVSVEDSQQNRYLGKVVYINPKVDVAFVLVDQLEDGANSSIVINPDLAVEERDQLFVLGYPFGMPFTITEGIVSSPDQPMGGSKYVQTDAAVNPGNSGGPMLDINGNLIAITTSKFTEADNVGFGIPYKAIQKEISTYEAGSKPTEFALACPSCHYLTYETSEYCNSCGSKLNKHDFETNVLDETCSFVESALEELGMSPVLARSGRKYWNFHQGSAFIRVFIYDETFLVATSPLNDLPSGNLEKLYEYLLSDPVKPYKLGISDNQIYLAFRTHLNDISSEKKEQVKHELYGLALKADEMDDYFVDKFQCPMTTYSKEELRRGHSE